MKPVFLKAVVALAFTFSQLIVSAQKPKTPIELNDHLAIITDSLFIGGREWGATFSKANEAKNFALLSTARLKLEKYIERKRIEVVTMKDIGGSEKLRLAMLDFLFFEKRMIKEAFMPFEKFNNKTPQSELDTAIYHLQDMAAAEEEYLADVRKAQENYGAKNGFTIEKE